MAEQQKYSLYDIATSFPERSLGGMQPVYMARNQARRASREHWQRESLKGPWPMQHDIDHTLSILDELSEMSQQALRTPENRETRRNGINTESVGEVERLLQEGQIMPEENPSIYLKEVEVGAEQRDPFLIRGHHISFFTELISFPGKWNPSSRAESNTQFFLNLRQDMKEDPDAFSDVAKWYVKDNIGDSLEEAKKRGEALKDGFERFMNLPDDHPIELVAGEPDEICKGCVIGEHCRKRAYALRPDGMVEHDTNVISTFVHEAYRQNKIDELKVFRRKVQFSNAPDETVEGIQVNAGTFKEIVWNAPVTWHELFPRLDYSK